MLLYLYIIMQLHQNAKNPQNIFFFNSYSTYINIFQQFLNYRKTMTRNVQHF